MNRAKYSENLALELSMYSEGFDRLNWGYTNLEAHQTDAMIKASAAIQCWKKSMSVVHCCGSWKSVLIEGLLTASSKVKELIWSWNDSQDIVIVPERAIRTGMLETLDEAWLDIWLYIKGWKIQERQIVLANIETLQKNMGDFQKKIDKKNIWMLVWDEADTHISFKRAEILQIIGEDSINIGLTATPKWMDWRHIWNYWWEVVSFYPIEQSILDWNSAPPIFKLIEADIPYGSLEKREWEYTTTSVSRALKSIEIWKIAEQIYEWIVEKGREKDYPCLVFLPSTDLVEKTTMELQESLRGRNLEIKSWTWKSTSANDIKIDSASMRKWNIDILVLCRMWGRWVNIPRAKVVIDCDISASENRVEQKLSRVSRIIRPGTPDAEGGYEKDFCVIVQITPTWMEKKQVLFPQLLWNNYQEVLTTVKKRVVGNQSNRSQLERIEQDLTAINWKSSAHGRTNLVSDLDVYKMISNFQSRATIDKHKDSLLNWDAINGENWQNYAIQTKWASYYWISPDTIYKRIKKDEENAKKVMIEYHWLKFYPQSYILDLFWFSEDWLGLEFDTEGITNYNWEKYAQLQHFIPFSSKNHRLALERVKKEEGIMTIYNAKVSRYYPIKYLMDICHDLIEEESEIDSDWFSIIWGKRYGTIQQWSTCFDLPTALIKGVIQNKNSTHGSTVQCRKYKNKNNYSEDIIREVLKEYLCLKKSCKDWYIYFNENEKSASVKKLSSTLAINLATLKGKVDIEQWQVWLEYYQSGENYSYRRVIFYTISYIKSLFPKRFSN
jgi:superfamily II DNA or RNA helicase